MSYYGAKIRDTIVLPLRLLKTLLEISIGPGHRAIAYQTKHVLLLAWDFPPAISGGVYRPASFTKYGKKLGWKVSVIAREVVSPINEAGAYLVKSMPEDINIKYIRPSRVSPSHRFSMRISGGLYNALEVFSTAKKMFPQDAPQVVFATGPPFHNFVAAYFVSSFFRCKMILDYRDEWTECPFEFVGRGNADRFWENICLKKANAVFFTTKSQMEHQVKTFSCLDGKRCHVIPNGWEPEDFHSFDNSGRELSSLCTQDEILISFIGRLGNHTPPKNFLLSMEKVIRQNEKLRKYVKIQFIGSRAPEAEKQISQFAYPEILDIKDHVPKSTANLMMQQASLLLLMYDKRFERYIPGKFYDYLASGTPILVIGQSGEVVDLVKELEAGYVIPENDVDALAKIILNLMTVECVKIKRQQIDEWLKLHTREKMSKRMLGVIEGLIA